MNCLLTTIPYWGIAVFLPLLPALFHLRHSKADEAATNILLWSMSALLVSLLWRPVGIFWTFGLTLACWLFYLYKTRPEWHFRSVAAVTVAYWAYFLLSVCWSGDRPKGLLMSIDLLPMALLGLIPSTIRLSEAQLARIFRPFCQAAGIFMLIVLLSFFVTCHEMQMSLLDWPILQKASMAGYPVYNWVFRFMGGVELTYSHPSYNTLPLFFASATAIWMARRRWFNKVITALLLPGTLFTVLISQSRMGLIYCAILTFAGVIYLSQDVRIRWRLTAIMAMLGITLFGAVQQKMLSMKEDANRDYLTRYTLEYIQTTPLLGSGAGALNPITICHATGVKWWPLVGEIDADMSVRDWKPKNPVCAHNQFLASWAQNGILGLLLCIALYATLATHSLRKRSFWAISFWPILLIMSFLEPPLFIPKGLYLFATFATLIAAYHWPPSAFSD